METLKIENQEDTPGIVLDKSSGTFEISGRSLPEDVSDFYGPVLDWLDNYFQDPNPNTLFNFKLEYFNTASSKILLDIMMKLEDAALDTGTDVKINWHYDPADRDLQEAGEEYSELIDIEFVLIES